MTQRPILAAASEAETDDLFQRVVPQLLIHAALAGVVDAVRMLNYSYGHHVILGHGGGVQILGAGKDKSGGLRVVSGKVIFDKSGEMFFRGLAREEAEKSVAASDNFDASTARMGGGW